MAKKAKSFDRTKGVLVVVMGLMAAVAFVSFAMMRLYIDRLEVSARMVNNAGVHIELGMLEYDFDTKRDALVLRSDDSVKSLRTFLEQDGKDNIRLGCQSVHYNVLLVNEDEEQVLMEFGCNEPNARAFLVRSDTGWTMLSPTNQFDVFGTPSCEHVDSAAIDASIAPVCHTEQRTSDSDSGTLRYRVRS